MRRPFDRKESDEYENAFSRSYARILLAIARYQRKNGGEPLACHQIMNDAGKLIRRACQLTMQRSLG